MPVVDIHPHVISTDEVAFPVAPVGGKRSRWSQERQLTGDQLITAMDDAGVAAAALVQASSVYGHDNTYVAQCVSEHPSRLTGVYSIDPQNPASADIVQRAWDRGGFGGIRFFTTGSALVQQQDWIDHPAADAVWDLCARLGIPICMQMDRTALEPFRRMVAKHPTTRVLLDHLAFPDIDEGKPFDGSRWLFDLAEIGPLYLKATTITVDAVQEAGAAGEDFFAAVLERFGARRIAWGSNFPASAGTLAELTTRARDVFGRVAGAADLEWVLGGTALELYPSLAAAVSA